MKIVFLCTLLVFLSGCVFYPKEAHYQGMAAKCGHEMHTKKLTLELSDAQMRVSCGNAGRGPASLGCVALLSFIPAASFVVSGSIVLVGNAIHWLEYESQCTN
ncbi:hypothetical protein [uncultured Psychrosphaera sp.]|uniref:hypothetical protein n=1 Tax=uncultured Psychrosphaera sp. TaxID=1403522 RepID=UPI00262F071B|nr:hypothetical protein [uncultured Psychrosphaera sp.]